MRSSSLPSAPAVPAPPQASLVAMAGNPNCGKSTVFNLLTGLRQKVANYPGVTVEKRVGETRSLHGKPVRIIDLPGAYSLNARSPDEAILRDVLLGRQAGTERPDKVICVADASNLPRQLYLVSQILELGLPTILVLNMMDVAEQKLWHIDAAKLSERLGIPVIPMQASSGKGLAELKIAMSRDDLPPPPHQLVPLPSAVSSSLLRCRDNLVSLGEVNPKATLLEPLYLLSDHDPVHYGIASQHLRKVNACRQELETSAPGWEDQLVTDRHAAIDRLLDGVLTRPSQAVITLTAKLDDFLLHPLWGGLNVLLVLGLLFYLIFKVAEGPMNWIESGFGLLGTWVEGAMPPGDLRDLLVNGAIQGVNGVVIFLPQILILFFFIAVLEDTGYMARLAFIMDRFMSLAGLSGKSFLPILSSYACAVPGVMATRTVEHPRDRLVTILVAPLASCSARLPVYSLLIGAFFPSSTVSAWSKAGIMLALYAAGTLAAFGFAWIFSRNILRGSASPMILELPSYKVPSLKTTLFRMWESARLFLVRAGTIILALSILVWAASTYPKSGSPDPSLRLEQSFAGRAGHLIEPLIRPLGYDWKIGIGLLSSFAAREVFVSTMSVIYAVETPGDEDLAPLRDRLRAETDAAGKPVYTPLVCASLLVFYIFAMQCLSTLAIVKRETNGWRWPLFQLGYLTVSAYLLSLLVYQGGLALGWH